MLSQKENRDAVGGNRRENSILSLGQGCCGCCATTRNWVSRSFVYWAKKSSRCARRQGWNLVLRKLDI